MSFLTFLPFKSKVGITLLSLESEQIDIEYIICNKQTITEKFGDEIYDSIFGRFHKEKDEPSIIMKRKSTWHRNDKMHRTRKDENGLTLPARKSKYCEWYNNGKRHRIDKDKKGNYMHIQKEMMKDLIILKSFGL